MIVLDASAILAYLNNEPGWEMVEPFILDSSVAANPVNLAEAASKLIERGMPPDEAIAAVAVLGLTLLPYGEQHAGETARLRATTKKLGLSLGDRACLASARISQLPVLTSDRPWLLLAAELQLDIRCLRPDAH